MGKHAYLIMAHTNFEQLKIELKMLDDKRNDIYLHIDKKAKNVDINDICSVIEDSNIYLVKRHNVKWAGFSVVECELSLLKQAMNKTYEYYHLLSGLDLPLRSQDEIHKFFQENKGKEFVSFDLPKIRDIEMDRVKYYRIFQDKYGRNRRNLGALLLYGIDELLIGIQKIFCMNRVKEKGIIFQKGTQWFSITHQLAKEVLDKEKWIKKNFLHTFGSDEMFLQTIVNNSELKERLYQNGLKNPELACLRKIDWNRGKPYTWRKEDYKELMTSKCLFARKFDGNIDYEIIEKLNKNHRKKGGV